MLQGKYMSKETFRKKPLLFLVSMMLLILTIGGTLAYLLDTTEPIVNTFTPTGVPNHVVETLDGSVKRNVQIQNDGVIDAYVRVAVVVNWADANGNVYGAERPKLDEYEQHYSLSQPSPTDWVKKGDYYYFPRRVASGGTTEILFSECSLLKKPVEIPENYNLSVEIIGQTIQADGVDATGKPAVELAWGVAIKADGTLDLD